MLKGKIEKNVEGQNMKYSREIKKTKIIVDYYYTSYFYRRKKETNKACK